MAPAITLRQLHTLAAFAATGGVAAAGRAVGLSHSAVSLQLKALEDAVGTPLIDRASRPPRLTGAGRAAAAHAARIAQIVEEIAALGAGGALRGTLALGVVPTALVHMLPPALARLREEHPDLLVRVRAGLSGDLAEAVRAGELDAALVTAPAAGAAPAGLALTPVAREPLVLIASDAFPEETPEALIAAHPFIWFSRRTWAGRQIEHALALRGLVPADAMETDALEAIEALVRARLGVSVVPLQTGAGAPPPGLRRLPLAGAERVLALIEREGSPKTPLTALLAATLAG